MMLVPSSVVSRVKSINESAMPDSVTVYRAGSATTDAYGGSTSSFTKGNTYVCRFRPLRDHERKASLGEQYATDPLVVFSMPADAQVKETDRLRYNAIDYEVIGWLGERSFKVGISVIAKEVKPETVQENAE